LGEKTFFASVYVFSLSITWELLPTSHENKTKKPLSRFFTVSKDSTVKGRLRRAEKIVKETRLERFFVLTVAS